MRVMAEFPPAKGEDEDMGVEAMERKQVGGCCFRLVLLMFACCLLHVALAHCYLAVMVVLC
jgi:hypothetical protein